MEPLTLEAIDRLRKLGGDAFLCKMIVSFLEFGGQKVAEARAASDTSDFDGAARAAHAIKSSAANLGAKHVERIATAIEENVLAERIEAIPEMVKELQDAFAEVKPHLEAQKQAAGSAGDSGS